MYWCGVDIEAKIVRTGIPLAADIAAWAAVARKPHTSVIIVAVGPAYKTMTEKTV